MRGSGLGLDRAYGSRFWAKSLHLRDETHDEAASTVVRVLYRDSVTDFIDGSISLIMSSGGTFYADSAFLDPSVTTHNGTLIMRV